MNDRDDGSPPAPPAPPPERTPRARAMTRTHSSAMMPHNEASVAKLMRWLQGHDNDGACRVETIHLVYQTAADAASDRSPQWAEAWTVDAALEGDPWRARMREIAEAAWSYAAEVMSIAKVVHLWKLVRHNAEDQHAGALPFQLEPARGSSGDAWIEDPPNDRGAYAATLRSLKESAALHMQAADRYGHLTDRVLDRLFAQNDAQQNTIATMQANHDKLADASEARKVDTAIKMLDLRLKERAYDGIASVLEQFIAQRIPLPIAMQKFARTVNADTLGRIATVLTPTEMAEYKPLLESLARELERQNKLRAEAEAANAAPANGAPNGAPPNNANGGTA